MTVQEAEGKKFEDTLCSINAKMGQANISANHGKLTETKFGRSPLTETKFGGSPLGSLRWLTF